MSTWVLMKVLESSAHRYDRGVRLLSRGRIGDVYETIAARVAAPERRILDVGCGTGGVALACAARGAHVVGIDRNADMLEVARSKPVPADAGGSVEWLQLGAAEIEDQFQPATFDAVTASLVLSELSPAERAYTLRVSLSRLKPGGGLVVADEVLPRSRAGRALHRLLRLPLVAVTYLLTQTTTGALDNVAGTVRSAGFADVHEQRLRHGGLAILEATRPGEAPS